jgi:hypothetical protein
VRFCHAEQCASARISPIACGAASRGQENKWHLDEVFIRIQGVQRYLWRAVDQDGIVAVACPPLMEDSLTANV